MRYVIIFILLLFCQDAAAQADYQQQQNMQEMQNNPIMQMSRSLLKSSGNQRKALNLLVVQEVASYKLGDEGLKNEINGLKNNREYYRKLEIIKKNLSNSKMSDSKNREVMRILNDAGNRLYILLSN